MLSGSRAAYLNALCDPDASARLAQRARHLLIKSFHICPIYPEFRSIAKAVDYATTFARDLAALDGVDPAQWSH